MRRPQPVAPLIRVENAILSIRGQKVMLDEELAGLYGVSTKRLNEQVKRNLDRFPEEFMFRLTQSEWTSLKSQIATSKTGRGGRRSLPYVFTEYGAVMLANVLSSPRAIQASIQIVRAFIRLREILASHEDLARKLKTLERKYDKRFHYIFDAIRMLMSDPSPVKRRPIGFRLQDEDQK